MNVGSAMAATPSVFSMGSGGSHSSWLTCQREPTGSVLIHLHGGVDGDRIENAQIGDMHIKAWTDQRWDGTTQQYSISSGTSTPAAPLSTSNSVPLWNAPASSVGASGANRQSADVFAAWNRHCSEKPSDAGVSARIVHGLLNPARANAPAQLIDVAAEATDIATEPWLAGSRPNEVSNYITNRFSSLGWGTAGTTSDVVKPWLESGSVSRPGNVSDYLANNPSRLPEFLSRYADYARYQPPHTAEKSAATDVGMPKPPNWKDRISSFFSRGNSNEATPAPSALPTPGPTTPGPSNSLLDLLSQLQAQSSASQPYPPLSNPTDSSSQFSSLLSQRLEELLRQSSSQPTSNPSFTGRVI